MIAWLLACADAPPIARPTDADGDGYSATDCDDADAAVFPGAPEVPYDGVDQDCAGDDDQDRDGDGVGVESDCDDGDVAVFPGAADPCGDGADGDCDGLDPACTWPAEVDLDDTPYRWTGQSGEDLGWALAAADTTGDGVDDLIVAGLDVYVFSAPLPSAGEARDVATVLPLQDTVEALTAGDLDGDGVAEVMVGRFGVTTVAGTEMEWSREDDFACAGDTLEVGEVTGDGAADLLVGAPCASDEERGRIYVAGPEGGDLADAAAVITGEPGDLLGWDLVAAGDVDGDGVGDLASAVYSDGSPVACVWLGGLRGDLRRLDAEACWRDDLGIHGYFLRVAPVGDLDADGLADLVLLHAQYDQVGAAVVLTDVTDAGALSEAHAAFVGEGDRGGFGAGGAGVGDLDADGHDDLAIGWAATSAGADFSGAVAVWTGPIPAGLHLAGEAPTLLAGGEPEAGAGEELLAGDFDGDGAIDLVVAGPAAGGGEGAVHLVVDRGE